MACVCNFLPDVQQFKISLEVYFRLQPVRVALTWIIPPQNHPGIQPKYLKTKTKNSVIRYPPKSNLPLNCCYSGKLVISVDLLKVCFKLFHHKSFLQFIHIRFCHSKLSGRFLFKLFSFFLQATSTLKQMQWVPSHQKLLLSPWHSWMIKPVWLYTSYTCSYF